MNRCFLIVAFAAITFAPLPLGAQDPFAAPAGGDPFAAPGGADPFGGGAPMPAGGAPFGAPAAAAGAAPVEVDPLPDPLILELQRYSQGSNQQLAVAIRSAVQIADWQQVAAFLDILAAKPLPDAEAAAIARTIRPNYLLRIQGHADLTEAQRDVVVKVITGAQKHAENRDRIKAAIAKLQTADGAARLEAIDQIRSGGLAAVGELATAYVAEKPVADRTEILGVLARFENEGPAALRQLALHGTPSARPHALEGLIALDLAGSVPDLVAGYLGKDASESERKIAATGLSQAGLRGMPSLHEAQIYLGGRVERAADFASRTRNDTALLRVWQLDEKQQTLQAVELPKRLALTREAADAATRFGRLDVGPTQIGITAQIAELTYQMMRNPEYGTTADYAARFTDDGPSASQIVLLERTLSAAIDRRNEYAAIAAIRLLKQSATAKAIVSHSGTPTQLVDTALHPSPRVRFEAAIAVAAIDQKSGYTGSSELLHRWLEMSGLQRRPTALILEARRHLTRDKLGWLDALGYDVEIVASVADLLRRIEKGGDIQLLLASSQPYDRHIIETIDLVRRRPLGGSFPILIYCQPAKTIWDEDLRESILDSSGKIIVDVAGSESALASSQEPNDTGLPRVERTEIYDDVSLARKFRDLRASHLVREERNRIAENLGTRWPAPLAVVEEIVSPMGLAEMLRDLKQSLPMPPMTSEERRNYAAAGLTALAAVTNPDEPNNPYDFRSHEPELTNAIQTGGFSDAGLTLLSTLGTPNSQLTLANLVDSPALPITMRQAAAEAFKSSVMRFGTRIDRKSVARQYERYNAAADQADRAALGVILDAMEQRANATSR